MTCRAALLALVILAARARPAEACSHPASPGTPHQVFPPPGQLGVPTNAVITVYWSTWGTQPETLSWRLRDPAAALTELTVSDTAHWGTGELGTTSFHLTPPAPLATQTRYDLVMVDGDVVVEAGSFTTGDGEDVVAPDAPVVDLVPLGPPHSCQSRFSCCDSLPRTVDVQLVVTPSEDLVAYTLREGATTIAAELPLPLAGVLACGAAPAFGGSPWPTLLPEWLVVGETHELTLVARDAAGNESPAVAISIAAECDEADTGTGELPADEGCAVGGGGGGAWLIALLIVVAWRRRCGR